MKTNPAFSPTGKRPLRLLHALVGWLRGKIQDRKMRKALRETRKRVSAMSADERQKLYERGIEMLMKGGRK